MKLIRNEFPDQGTMYAGPRGWFLYPPDYIFRYGPPMGDVRMGAWVAEQAGHSYGSSGRFATLEQALAYISAAIGQEVSLETSEERLARHSV